MYTVWKYINTDAVEFSITFSEDTYIEEGYDYIAIENSIGNVEKYTGDELAGKKLTFFQESVIKVYFITDESGNGEYGFKVTNIETKTEQLTYVFDEENGVLYINGEGDMCDYGNGKPKWSTFEIRDAAKTIVIGNGVTSIGSKTFCDFYNVTKVKIANTVSSIGTFAFYGCRSLTRVNIPESVMNIGYYAFSGCNGLTDVYYSGSEDDWATVTIGEYNNALKNATIDFGKESVIIPDTEGRSPKIGKTTLSFTPEDAIKGDIIAVIAVKDGVSTSYAKTYSGEGDVTFVIEDGFDSIKILVWDSYESMEPLMDYAMVE